jgi:hypothetical protein
MFIHVNMYIYVHMFIKSLDCSSYVAIRSGFRVSNQVSVIRGLGFGHKFSPESVFGSVSGFKFGFWFWVPRHSTRSEPDPLPYLGRRTARGGAGRQTRRRARRRQPTGPPGHQSRRGRHQNEEEAKEDSPGISEGRERHRRRRSGRRLRRAGSAPAAAALHNWGREEEWRGV